MNDEPCPACDGKRAVSYEGGRYLSRCMACHGTGKKHWKRYACKKCRGEGYLDGNCTECHGGGLK